MLKIEDSLHQTGQLILQEFGSQRQKVKTIEELGELITVLSRELNGRVVSEEAVIDEIADVLITVFQMRHLYNPEKVDVRIRYKLDRTIQFIENLQSEGHHV